MNKSFIFIFLLSVCSVYAQQNDRIAEKVVMRNGIFWPKYQTESKFFLDGQLQDPSIDINDPLAVSNALSSVPSLREDATYLNTLGSLLFASKTGAAPEIAQALGNELGWMIENGSLEDAYRLSWDGADLREFMENQPPEPEPDPEEGGLLFLGPGMGVSNPIKEIGVDFARLGISGDKIMGETTNRIDFSGSSFEGMDFAGVEPSTQDWGGSFLATVAPDSATTSAILDNTNFSNARNLNPEIFRGQASPSYINLSGTGITQEELMAARHNYLLTPGVQSNSYAAWMTQEERDAYLAQWVSGFILN